MPTGTEFRYVRRATSTPSERGTAQAVGDALRSVPWPLLLAGADGRVRWANTAATTLLPGVTPGTTLARHAPAWLADAHARRDREAAGVVGGRAFRAEAAETDDTEQLLWWLRDDTDLRSARLALRAERARARVLAEATEQLSAAQDPRACRAITVGLAARHLADAAVLVGAGRGVRPPVATARRGGDVTHGRLTGDPADVPGLAEALEGFPPVPSGWLDPAAVPPWLLPDSFGTPDALMVVPLPGTGAPVGALIMMRRAGGEPFTESEEAFGRHFAARAAAALTAATHHAEQTTVTELLARDAQPPGPRRVDGVEYASGHRPADDAHPVGGDFLDISPAPEAGGETHVVLGDVCGKGLEAAVIAGKIRTTLRALHLVEPDHQRLLRLLNSALTGTDHSRFATLVLASAKRRGEDVALRLTSAGHPRPLIVRLGGDVEAAPTHGTLIGALPEVSARTHRTTLRPGEACLLYSDGITEAKGGPFGTDRFGEARLRAALAECAGQPPEAMAERVQMLAADWLGGRRHDDMAVVVIGAPRG